MKPLKIFIILTSSLLFLLVPKKIALACGFYVYPGEYRFWLLQPDLTNQQDLTPFFFSSNYLYKGDIYAAVEIYPDKNIDEWYSHIHQKAAKKDIDSLLNYTDPDIFFANEKEIARRNSFLSFLLKPQNKELYQYLKISKKVERIAANPDPWEEKKIPYEAISRIIDEAEILYQRAGFPFIKLRTAYQLVRLYGLNDEPDKLTRQYDARVAPVKTNSWIKTAALYQKAIYTKGYKGDYLLSKVFDRGGYRRSLCLMRIRTKHIDSILPYAKNRHERIVLTAMKTFNHPGRSLFQIKKIYQAEPGYKDLSFLLLREINKVEDWLLTIKLTEFGRPAVYNGSWWEGDEYRNAAISNYQSDKLYALELYQFLLQLVSDKKQPGLAVLQLYAAHLALVQGNLMASENLLSQIQEEQQLSANVKTQLRVNRFLLRLENGFDAATESEFMQIIKTPSKKLGIYDAPIMKNQLILYTARKLVKKGIKAKGLMLMSRTNRALGQLPISKYKGVYQEIAESATPAVYDEILAALTRKTKTPFEQFIFSGSFDSPWNSYDDDSERWDKNKILDNKASWYIRNHDLPSALTVLKQIPDSFFAKEPFSIYIGGNPFYLNVYHAHTVTVKDRRNLNKKQVVEQMIRLEKIAEKEPQKKAECYFQLANAWYNMSWYGKNWLIVKQWWSDLEMYDNGEFKHSAFNEDYYGCNKAKQYYLKSLQYTNDKELATLSCFMAGVCENNFQLYKWTLRNLENYEAEYKNKANPFRNRLRQKGVDNKAYIQLVKECALYVDYIGKYNRTI